MKIFKRQLKQTRAGDGKLIRHLPSPYAK